MFYRFLGAGIFSIAALCLTGCWTKLSPTGGPPSQRVSHTAVYNSKTNVMTIFGGQLSDATTTNDVWILSKASGLNGTPVWTQLSPMGAPIPARSSHSAVYNPATDRMTVFGGFFGALTALNDVWVLSNADGFGGTPAWTKLAPSGDAPPARFDHSAVYHSTTDRMIVFGGDDGAVFNDVWVLSNADGLGGTATWTKLAPSGGPPSARFDHSAVYDPTTNRMVVFGGTSGAIALNDIWMLSNANGLGGPPAWTQLTAIGGPPAARYAHTAVYNPATSSMIVFAGCASGGINFCHSVFNDVWVLSNANGVGATPAWTQLTAIGGPPAARAFHTAVYDLAANVMIIFAGAPNYAFPPPVPALNDVWTLSGANGVPPWSSRSKSFSNSFSNSL